MDASLQAEDAELSAERCVRVCARVRVCLYFEMSRLLSCLFSPRLKEFKSSLFAVFQSAHAQSVKMSALMDDINKERQNTFAEAEVRGALARMQDDNQVMVADDIIFLI